ncbi:MAG: hypothetical protein KIPDCIKN_02217 [Haliscomenobacter sp.]|jgi:ribosomal-protein-alanine N-acetyltransferase|nr:hypothetical protein [Haliscomenobacter sp.]
MDHTFQLYNAGTGMEPWVRAALVKFISAFSPGIPPSNIRDAIDCVLKNIPSFGGFVVVAWSDRTVAGAIVVNRTGMSGFGPENLLTFAVAPGEGTGAQILLEALIRKGMDYTEGEIAYHLPLRHPALKLFQDLGFKRQFVELRFSPEKLKAEA